MKRLFWLLLMWCSLTATQAQAPADTTRLQVMLQDEIFETSTVGIKVYDLTARTRPDSWTRRRQ